MPSPSSPRTPGATGSQLWLNLGRYPEAGVAIGKERRSVRARKATKAQFERLWPHFVAGLRAYETYRRRTDRSLTIVLLSPRRDDT